MGNCFKGNSRSTLNQKSTKKLHPSPQAITSMQDIRKVYKFSQKAIGHGHFGTVRIAMLLQNPGKKYAVKSILKQKIQKDFHLFQRELSILRQLDHPNIIKFYETYQDNKFFHLVMEYCKGGELFDRIAKIGHFSEIEAMNVMKSLFLAVKYLHEQGICHRDLKPENLLYSDNTVNAQIKIIDFGLSRQFDLEKEFSQNLKQMNTMVGTALYVAPEVIKGTKYNSSCDNWSLGVILYILLCGYPPFTGSNQTSIFDKITSKNLQFQGKEWKKISKEARDLISKLVCDAKYRITINQALRHKWFSLKLQKSNEQEKKIDPNVVNLIQNFRGVDVIISKQCYKYFRNFKKKHQE